MRLLFLFTGLVATAASQSCNASLRKEWGRLTAEERTDYIDAVWCLRELPSVLPNSVYPGVKDRLDDFVATHINYTMVIHQDGLFLPWHRHYLHLWEKALRDECGYRGSLPYWDWNISPDLSTNPIFDNSATSLSGDGLYDATAQSTRDPTITNFPPGHGGGCVTGGPFQNFSVHMGPFGFDQAYPYAPLPANTFSYNPRCLQRNLQPAVLRNCNNPAIVSRLRAAADIGEFLQVLDKSHTLGGNVMGPHGGGHDAVGPTMGDMFASPQDPVFMLHHAMVDRMWWEWQGRDAERLTALNGTGVLGNPPGEKEVTLETVVWFGELDGPRRLGDLMDALAGDYCYGYE